MFLETNLALQLYVVVALDTDELLNYLYKSRFEMTSAIETDKLCFPAQTAYRENPLLQSIIP